MLSQLELPGGEFITRRSAPQWRPGVRDDLDKSRLVY